MDSQKTEKMENEIPKKVSKGSAKGHREKERFWSAVFGRKSFIFGKKKGGFGKCRKRTTKAGARKSSYPSARMWPGHTALLKNKLCRHTLVL